MVSRFRWMLALLIICACLLTGLYFYYTNYYTPRTHFRKVESRVEIQLRKTFCRFKNLLPLFYEDVPDLDELIEKNTREQTELLKKKNEANHAKTKIGLSSPSIHPASTNKPMVEWINTTEGKQYTDYGDNTCGDNPQRKTLTQIFSKWVEIATKLNITYFLTCGTLLGAWRNGDIIPYDSDMDVLIDQRDAVKLEKVESVRNFFPTDGKIRLVLQEDWRLQYSDRRMFSCDGCQVPDYEGECSFQTLDGRLIKDGYHLDIYAFQNVKGILYDPSGRRYKFEVNDVFPLKKCRFLGQVTYCPKNPTTALHHFYGNIINLTPDSICVKGEWWIRKHRRNATL